MVAKLSIKKRLLKVGLLAIFILVVLPGICLGAYGGLNYYQAKSLVAEADSLVKVEKFDQAIEKYALAEARWSPKSLKDEINSNLEQAQKLKEEKENYDKGIKYFDEEKWGSAKDAFDKITDTSKYYEEAQEKLKTIAEKIEAEEKAKAQIKGAKTSTSPAQATTPTPQPTTNPNKDSICRNEAELYKIQEKEKAIAQLKSQRPELFWSEADWLAHGYSEADLPYLVPVYRNYYNTAMSILDNAAQQAYLTKYNECLQK